MLFGLNMSEGERTDEVRHSLIDILKKSSFFDVTLIVRIIFVLVSFFSIFVVGFLREINAYTYPIFSQTLLSRLWWDFYDALITASAAAIGIALVLVISISFWRSMHSLFKEVDNVESQRNVFPEWVVWVSSGFMVFRLLDVSFQPNSNLPLLGLVSIPLVFAFLLFGSSGLIHGSENATPDKNWLRSFGRILSTKQFILMCILFLLVMVPLSMGISSARDILGVRATCVKFVDTEGSVLVSLIDLRTNGVITSSRDHNTAEWPEFIPLSEIEVIRFGSGLEDLGCSLRDPPDRDN